MDTIQWRLGVFPVLPRGWWGIIGTGKVLTREKRGKEERKQGRKEGYWRIFAAGVFTPRKRKAILNDSDPNRINSAVMKSQ